MTENDPVHSGSRREPSPVGGDAPGIAWRSAPPAGESDSIPTDEVPAAPRRTGGRRGVLAGAGAGILVLGGLGGFAIGHAVAGAGTGDDSPSVVQSGFPGQDGVPDGGGDGHARPPGDGSPPAAPSAGDRGDDGDGDP